MQSPLLAGGAAMEGPQLYLDNGTARHRAELESRQARPRVPAGPTTRRERPHLPAPRAGAARDYPARPRGGGGNGYESDVPGFEGLLAEAEVEAILDYLKSEWPERERAHRARVTAADEAAGG